MLSRWWPRPKWIKHVAAQVGSAHPSSWNVTLYLKFKRSFSFLFHPFSNFPLQSFLESIRPKHDSIMINESSKSQSTPRPREKNIDRDACSIQHHTNSSEISYYGPLMEAAWPENHHPIYIPLFQRRRFSFPIDINFGWPRKSVTHPYQHKYWNTLFLVFHYHSTHIKLPKINSFLSIQLQTFSSQFHRHSYIHQHDCLNLLFLVCQYNW